ncbi:MAG: UDP-N-acetylmuramate--L-alanine ligase [Vampirovibrio sp.]|nr:UDP-N-acetylmuramate--L-alanine ligase [Vampirovibrio sp.]
MHASLLSQLSNQSPLVLNIQQPVHFVGIGGIGMSGLAKLLVEQGFTVSGSDAKATPLTQWLADHGTTIHIGHQAKNVPPSAAVIATTAVTSENSEIQAAINQGLGIYHRSDLLREILEGPAMGHTIRVGITGTHGKTTLTGMVACVLSAADRAPTVIAGGKLPQWNTNAILGKDRQIAVAELDESDGSLVRYAPTHTIISNLELDHAEHFPGGLADIIATVNQCLTNMPSGGHVFLNADCPNTIALLKNLPEGIIPVAFTLEMDAARNTIPSNVPLYGIRQAATGGVGDAGTVVLSATGDTQEETITTIQMQVPGRHNLLNGLITAAVTHQLEVSAQAITTGLAQFTGMGRRFEVLGQRSGATLVDDYAHHPTEIEATLQATRQRLSDSQGRIIAIFQPHRYTRLQALWDGFLHCFKLADIVYVTDVYEASEKPIPGIDSVKFWEALKTAYPSIHGGYLEKGDFSGIRQTLAAKAQPGDMILSLGAGDITQLFRGWSE